MARKTHKDLEFHVEDAGGSTRVFKNLSEAALLALNVSLLRGGEPSRVDVVAWSRGAARHWAGDDGVAQYEEDPYASVFERLLVTMRSEGRIP